MDEAKVQRQVASSRGLFVAARLVLLLFAHTSLQTENPMHPTCPHAPPELHSLFFVLRSVDGAAPGLNISSTGTLPIISTLSCLIYGLVSPRYRYIIHARPLAGNRAVAASYMALDGFFALGASRRVVTTPANLDQLSPVQLTYMIHHCHSRTS
jgi:hypothetical protein